MLRAQATVLHSDDDNARIRWASPVDVLPKECFVRFGDVWDAWNMLITSVGAAFAIPKQATSDR